VASIRVLFLCTGNSARSILAEALLKSMGGRDFDVHSAGTSPKGLNPYALRVLAANEVDAGGAESKVVTQFEGEAFDYVITLCDDAAENCPIFWGGTERLHWGFEDPAAVEGSDDEKMAAFQAVLDGLKTRMQPFVVTARGVKEGAR
jgi:arsenate reductase (thioredoxin)